MSPCGGWLRFLVGQKRSSSRLVILKSRPRIFATCHLWKCQYRVYWNLSYLLSILKVIFLKSNLFRLKKLSILSITNKNCDIGQVTQSVTVQREMLIQATFNQTNFYFSFMWHKMYFSYLICSYMRRFAIQNSLKPNSYVLLTPVGKWNWYTVFTTTKIKEQLVKFILELSHLRVRINFPKWLFSSPGQKQID